MYQASEQRYKKMDYHRCGHSGLKLPVVSLGLWRYCELRTYESPLFYSF